jgi:hypothetical protein
MTFMGLCECAATGAGVLVHTSNPNPKVKNAFLNARSRDHKDCRDQQ